MKRFALKYLEEWLAAKQRKPLILRGARQVGKTYTVRQLAEAAQIQLIEVNFEKQPQLSSLFTSNNPQEILTNLAASFSINPNPSNSLLFLDEIQTKPEILAKLRWFAEDMPELAVIAAGSLLDFALEEATFSMPVGRVTYMYMNPLSFHEYLLATNHQPLFNLIQDYSLDNDLPEAIHLQLTDLFKEYLIIGGMPAAVNSWRNQRSLLDVQRVHIDLLTSYRDDFTKYRGRLSIDRLDDIMSAIPRLLGNKFIYSQVNKEVRAAPLKQALQLLNQARVCQKVHGCHGNGVPLLSETNPKNQKVVFLDTGLALSQLGLKLHGIQMENDINTINSGAISEQVVGQLLQTIEPFYTEPFLCYWTRESKNSSAEIDFLLQHENKVIPIEVKSGKTGTLKSLHLFMQLKGLKVAIRINSDKPSSTPVHAQTNSGKADYQLLSIPFYMTEQIHRLLNQAFSSSTPSSP